MTGKRQHLWIKFEKYILAGLPGDKNDCSWKPYLPDNSFGFAVYPESGKKCITQHLDKEINYLPHSEWREWKDLKKKRKEKNQNGKNKSSWEETYISTSIALPEDKVFMLSNIHGDFYSFLPESWTPILEATSCQPSATPDVIFLSLSGQLLKRVTLILPTTGIPFESPCPRWPGSRKQI